MMIPFYQSRLRSLTKEMRELSWKKAKGLADDQEEVFLE